MIDTRKAINLADLRPEELEPILELQIVSFFDAGSNQGGGATGTGFFDAGSNHGGGATGFFDAGSNQGGGATGFFDAGSNQGGGATGLR